MEREILFTPQIRPCGHFTAFRTIAEMAGEQSPKSASRDQAAHRAGPVLLDMLRAFPLEAWSPPEGLLEVVDVRTQRLMPGMYPSIPGWHCDDWPRPHYHGQPDPHAIDERVMHWTGYAATEEGAPATEFVAEPLLIPLDLEGGNVWEQVHRFVEEAQPNTLLLPPGQVWEFSPMTIHRALPATARTWRQWGRVSWRSKRPTTLEAAEHVYIRSEGTGW